MSAVDRFRHGQLHSRCDDGDCFRACISVLLGVPNGDHIPNPHDQLWFFAWQDFLAPFGMAIDHSHAKGPIWRGHPWIASVPSKNCEGKSHAIVMGDRNQVLFDPSPNRRYHAGWSLLGKDVVLGGTWLEVSDASRLKEFVKWQTQTNRAWQYATAKKIRL